MCLVVKITGCTPEGKQVVSWKFKSSRKPNYPNEQIVSTTVSGPIDLEKTTEAIYNLI